MPSLSVPDAIAEVVSALGHPLSNTHARRLRRDPSFAALRDRVSEAQECADLVRAWENEERLERTARRDSPFLTDAELAYQRARSAAAALVARTDEQTCLFRAEVLGERLIEQTEIATWVKAQARRQGPPSLLVTHLISGRWSPGQPFPTDAKWVGTRERSLAFPTRHDTVLYKPVADGSTLDRLRAIGERLAVVHRWQPAQATTFVLTDAIPLVPVLSATTAWDPMDEAIRIQASREFSEGSVGKLFSRARQDILQGPHRALPARTWEVVAFVAVRPPGSTWGVLRREWDKVHADLAYGTDRAFALAARKGFARLGMHTVDNRI